MTASTVAVDVGGTSIKALAIDENGSILKQARIATSTDSMHSLAQLDAVIASLTAALSDSAPLSRVGVAVPGLVDTGRGVVQLATNLGWRDLALRDRLEQKFGVAVSVDNDARVGARAERAWVWPEDGDLAFVPIGTGVSASYTAFGRAIEGSTGSAGEFGHLRAVAGGELCTCGNTGCVEAYASAASILARYRTRGGAVSTVQDIIAACGHDLVAAGVWSDAIAALTAGLVALVTLLDPPRVVIGGGLSLAGDALLDPLRESVAQALPWRAAPLIVASSLGPHSSLVGAALPSGVGDSEAARQLAHGLASQLVGAPEVVVR